MQVQKDTKHLPGTSYWETYLEECVSCHFPTLGGVVPGKNWSVSVPLENDINAKIRDLCDNTGISVFTVLRVAWGLVLRTYTGQDLICFADSMTAASPSDTITNDQPTCISVYKIDFDDAEAMISRALKTTDATHLERLAITLPPVSESIRATLGVSDKDVFNTLMLFRAEKGLKSERPIANGEIHEVDNEKQYDVDIVVQCEVGESRACIVLDYQTSFISPQRATSIAIAFAKAIDHIVTHYDTNGDHGGRDQLYLLSDLDKSEIYKWNRNEPTRSHRCIDTLIHEQCLSQPNAPAVCAWDGDFSYKQLDELSESISRYLTALGIGPDVFVPLYFEKSRWTTIAMLGVIKAGGAFVLLDPSHPIERLRSICKSLSATVILSSVQSAQSAAELVATVIEIGDAKMDVFSAVNTRAHSATAPSNALYAIFTSGSTGVPKGIVSEHSSFHAAVSPYIKAVGLDQKSRVFQFSSYAFDVTIFDTLMTLISGGCLCVPSDDDRWSNVTSSMQYFRNSHASLTPTVARILDPKDLPTLKTLVLGGERLVNSDFLKWVDHVKVVNLYGASECSIMSIQSTIGNSSDFQINDHLTGSNCWIVNPNDHEKLLPIGAVGELVVEGSIVGRNYLDNAEKTAATFIQSPSWLRELRGYASSHKLYKSGDLARYTATGAIQFVGRHDSQVKLRGQRVELGEVEHHILRIFTHARDVVAEMVTTPDPSRTLLLVAFVRTGDIAEPNSRDRTTEIPQIIAEPSDWFLSQIPVVKSRLQQLLPSYMVPAVFLPLNLLPLTSSDKVNRKLLRELVAKLSREQLASYRPQMSVKRTPETRAEKHMQQYFAHVLHLEAEQVGADDHFFDLGGDSLAAMKLVAMARKDMYKLTVQNVFAQPQLSAIASIAQYDNGENDGEETIPQAFSLINKQRDIIRAAAQQCHLPVRSIEDVYPCTPLQQGLLAETMRNPRSFVADIPLSLPGNVDYKRLQGAWSAVAKAHPILRTRMILSNSHGLLQAVIREDIRWMVLDMNEDPNFMVGVGKPLVQLTLRRCQEEKQATFQLSLIIHHAIYDGLTLPLIFSEVEAAYNGNTLTQHLVSPFIRYLQSVPLGEGYWRSRMKGLRTLAFPALPSQTYRPLPNAITQAYIITEGPLVRKFTHNTHVRLAWALTQAWHQGVNDVFFGTVVSGRNAPVSGIESMTVPTVATVPCRVTINLENSIRKMLQEVQDDMVAGIPFEHNGLSDIRRLGKDAELASSFQTLLSMQPMGTRNDFIWQEQEDFNMNHRADATYGINLFCISKGNELNVTVIYDGNMVKQEEMQQMVSHFSRTLKVLHQSPDIQVRDILSDKGHESRY
ncbi:acetyl-CoA synthetase-like protein [Daldinia decipiens]|uniref:acetyl-CoA synthetase-like protein n=1 Tax=Daldinia decipiens TaxID=326647 RepID=UPI0020C287D6|nr:acetyl-CoA synthetase-like protein [Daldinia decipiens]KAI1658823.1 acetyl-CoA synthetase-like protein [Daldinia decipiens]